MKERHACEVRHLIALALKDKAKAREYLEIVEKKRGIAAAERLKKDARTQMDRGNRGKWGEWYETDDLRALAAV